MGGIRTSVLLPHPLFSMLPLSLTPLWYKSIFHSYLQVCGFLAPCFGILGLALAALELFLCDRCCVGCIVSFLFSFATIAQSLTFMFLRSDSFCSVTSCTIGAGGVYSIVAVSVMLLAGCTLGCIPKGEPLLTGGKGDD